jgi:hypothetical protein
VATPAEADCAQIMWFEHPIKTVDVSRKIQVYRPCSEGGFRARSIRFYGCLNPPPQVLGDVFAEIFKIPFHQIPPSSKTQGLHLLVRFCVVIGRGLSVAVYRFFLKATLEIGAGISGGVPREFKGLLGHSLNPDPPAASGTLKYDVRDAGHFQRVSRPSVHGGRHSR